VPYDFAKKIKKPRSVDEARRAANTKKAVMKGYTATKRRGPKRPVGDTGY
jgi:hypothetical protein